MTLKSVFGFQRLPVLQKKTLDAEQMWSMSLG